LDVQYGATPVVSTIISPRPEIQLQSLGGVALCPANRSDIRQLKDLRGKRVAAINPHSLGGALAVWRELKAVGIRYDQDLAEIRYLGTVNNVISAVVRGEVDCGIMASDYLEAYLYSGVVDRAQFHVLPPSAPYPELKNYPLASSTRLYPSSAFVKMQQTPMALANKVAKALLSVEPGSELARSMGVGGWSVPLNYQPVHECLQELRVPPYESFGQVTFAEAVKQHSLKVILALFAVVLALSAATWRMSFLNRHLRWAQVGLQKELEERVKAEAEREKLEDQLRQAQKLESLGRLAGGVAHDFNNLLTVINGYGLLLTQQLRADTKLGEYARQIAFSGERAASLTQQLLAFSRKQIINPRLLDLNAVVSESEKMLRRLLGEDVELVVSPESPSWKIKADEGQMHQVLMNLVVNARDAMPQGGKLVIETRNEELDAGYAARHSEVVPGKYVVLAVTDTGAGMDAETRERIFEPFFTTKAAGLGTGLGLSTVYGIVRQSGGWIWVYSEVGRGSCFKVYLPRASDAKTAEPEDRSEGARLTGTETILVVEDQEEVRRFVVTVLKAQGYNVLEASNGHDGLRHIQRHPDPVHLLFTDVVMPGMNGRELADRIRLLRPNIRILYSSGYTGNVIAQCGVLDPGVNYLVKPFSPAALAAAIRRVLDAPVSS
jgi:signal transduction histidine kinase/ActR/RegA family two-component response regulator